MAEKPPSPLQHEIKFFDTRSIHFNQFWATLIFVAEKPPPLQDEGNFLTSDLSISGNFEQLWFLWQKSQTPPRMREIFLTSDLSISGNFKQLWFLWQKSPPPQDEGNFFDTRSIHFRHFWATLVFVAEKPTSRLRENFWHQIYPFQAILSNFGFCGRKAHPRGWGKIFWHQIYPFQAILSNFDFCDRKATPHPNRMREIFLTPDLSISGNFEQLWFLWQKSPPARMRGNFLTPDLPISGNFEQLWFLWQKSHQPTQIGWGNIFWHQIYPFQAILSNFGFCDRNAPPPGWGEIFWHQIYPFQAISSNFGFCGRKAPLPQDEGKSFCHQIWAFQAILSNFGDRIAPQVPIGWGKFFWHQILLSNIQAILSNFGQNTHIWQNYSDPCQDHGAICDRPIGSPTTIHTNIPASNCNFTVAEKPHPPGWGNIFWHQIYPFQAILSNFGFCGRKVGPPRMRGNFWPDLKISGFLSNFGWQKGPSYPPRMREIFLTPDLSISGNFEQLWFLWQKSPPPSFLSFCQGLGSHYTGRIPKVPILQIHTQIPAIRISSIGYQLCQLFKILTYTELQNSDHGAYGRPIGSPITIHTNIPAITVTLLAKELWSVIRILSL